MKIDFKITTLPQGPESYQLIANTEGQLIIYDEEKILFSQDGILLVEFARILSEWLQNYESNLKKDFFYSSMDFEEEPVLAFYHTSNSNFKIASNLLEVSIKEEFDEMDLKIAAKNFLKQLYITLIYEGVEVSKFHSFML
ncbi:MAG: hypothetical protein ABJN57_06365 [Hyphomicrobiales bacterium]